MKEKRLDLKNINESIELVKTKGRHFVVPIELVANLINKGVDVTENLNVKGAEAEAVMLVALANTEEEMMTSLHDNVGHNIFLTMELSDEEETQVKKVHRYFGHRSGRRIWELFAKADKQAGAELCQAQGKLWLTWL